MNGQRNTLEIKGGKVCIPRVKDCHVTIRLIMNSLGLEDSHNYENLGESSDPRMELSMCLPLFRLSIVTRSLAHVDKRKNISSESFCAYSDTHCIAISFDPSLEKWSLLHTKASRISSLQMRSSTHWNQVRMMLQSPLRSYKSC